MLLDAVLAEIKLLHFTDRDHRIGSQIDIPRNVAFFA